MKIDFLLAFWEEEEDGQVGELYSYFNVQKLEKYSKVPDEKIVKLNNLIIKHISTSMDQKSIGMY